MCCVLSVNLSYYNNNFNNNLKSMKSILALAAAVFALAFLPLAEATANCLYCRRSGVGATLLVSYSYCAASDTCLQDRWLYIDRPCSSGWLDGKKLNMETQCKPKATTCHPFVSTNRTAGGWSFNFTETLGPNEYCKIDIDASEFVARVVLDDSVTLGAVTDNGNKNVKVG